MIKFIQHLCLIFMDWTNAKVLQNIQMNKLFSFFKEKITEANEQNKQELQTITQAFSESQYSKEKVLATLQSAKTNYMIWNIMIADEASTGLYYSQSHNRGICLRKIKGNKQLRKQAEANIIKLNQVKKTKDELRQIGALNQKWANCISQDIEGIFNYIDKRSKESSRDENEKGPTQVQQAHPQQEPIENIQTQIDRT